MEVEESREGRVGGEHGERETRRRRGEDRGVRERRGRRRHCLPAIFFNSGSSQVMMLDLTSTGGANPTSVAICISSFHCRAPARHSPVPE